MNKKAVIIAAGALAVIIVVGLALMLVNIPLIATAATAPRQIGNVVFKTPEEAITSYIAGLAKCDVDKILRQFPLL